MNQHAFSDDKPIQEIIQSYLNIDISNKPLKKLLGEIAADYDRRYSNTQPTYAAHSIFYLKQKFDYLINRVIELYALDNNNTSKARFYFWELTEALQKVRQAAKPWPDYYLPGTIHKIPKISTKENKTLTEVSKFKPVDDITLYEYQDARLNLKCNAYFEMFKLIICYWKMSDIYDEEYYIKVGDEGLTKLYRVMEIENGDRSALLEKLLVLFAGEKACSRIESYFDDHNIVYDTRVKRD